MAEGRSAWTFLLLSSIGVHACDGVLVVNLRGSDCCDFVHAVPNPSAVAPTLGYEAMGYPSKKYHIAA